MIDRIKPVGMFIRAWWDRARGRLAPTPCLYSYSWVLDSPIRAWSGASPAHILNAFRFAPGERVLEIGPGTGYYSVEAAGRVGATGQLICLDIQKDMLQALNRRLHEAGAASFSLLQGDATWLPLQSGALDHVFLITVLGELPDLARALREIRRVLKRDGRLSVSEQFPDPDFITLGVLRQALIGAGFTEERSQGRLAYTSTWQVR
jgi:ubiquinone/menaquinone biosynthesis C-methylase UbiE